MNLKNIILLPLLVIFIALFGCNKKDSNPVSTGGNGGGVGGGGTGSVSFQVNVVQDTLQNYYFEFKPDTNATIDTIGIICQEASVNAVAPGDGKTVFNQTNPAYLGITANGVTLASGQHWAFTIRGRIESQTGKAYTSNASYTVP